MVCQWDNVRDGTIGDVYIVKIAPSIIIGAYVLDNWLTMPGTVVFATLLHCHSDTQLIFYRLKLTELDV